VTYEVHRDGFLVTTDVSLIDVDRVHRFLSQESYWAADMPRERFVTGFKNSIPLGAFRGGEQAGFCRIITDRATFAYLADVFVYQHFRGQGVSKLMIEAALAHPEVQGLKRWMLGTRDAHGLYARFGFSALSTPGRWMEFVPADTYCTSE
jgi:GNAT superfamily N-acetyltransferase